MFADPEHIQKRAAEEAGAVATYTAEQRDDWLRALGPGQTGWVWRLSLLATPRVGDKRPSADMAAICYEVGRRVERGARVIEGASGVSSDDKPAFAAALRAAGGKVASGRSLKKRRAVSMGKARGAWMTENSAAHMLRTTHAAHLKMIVALWKSTAYPTREARSDAINDMLSEANLRRLGSWQTIWRALTELEAI